MNFSMPSFFVGVGTVVGAIALGFGGGVLLTSSAVKDTAAPPRVERAAHPDPVNAPKIVARAEASKPETATPPQAADPAAGAQPSPTVIPLSAQAASVSIAPQTAIEPVAAGQAPVLARDTEELSPREVERQRRAERRLARKKLETERRARAQAVAKMRQQQFEVREQAKPELAFEREDVSFDFFGRNEARSRDTFGRE